jgi:membrane-bound serine protease (ClpP class)
MIWWAVLLFFAGIVLIYAEFILPGGICGATGLLMLLGSGALGVSALPGYEIFVIVGELAGAAVAIALGMRMLARGRGMHGLRHDDAQRVEDGYINVPDDLSLVGQQGAVFSALRPSGAILVNGRRVDAVSDGTFIDAGRTVRVVEVHGNRVVVEAVEESGQPSRP